MSAFPCPTDAELRAFCLGKLASDRSDQTAEHITACRVCEDRLAEFDGADDELIGSLAGNSRGATCLDVPDRLIEVARNAVRRSQGSSSLGVDSGQAFARQLHEGGCRVGRFELLAELGVGSFGHVFKATDTELKRTVALKIERSAAHATEEAHDRFLREARSIAQLRFPGIVALHEAGHTNEGVCYLVTEYIEGTTLETRLAEERLEFEAAADLAASLADALTYAHEHGVIHRDLKPSNVLLDEEGIPHLADFGLAKRESVDSTLTVYGEVMGTPAYMSPEQARGDAHEADARSDVYSLGVVLYELLTGEKPFQGNRRIVLLQVLEDSPRDPRQLDAAVPIDLQTICLKAIAKEPSRRYQSAALMAADLRRYLRREPILARPAGRLTKLWRWCHRNPTAASLLAGVSIGSLVGFIYLSSLSQWFVKQTALESVRMQTKAFEHFNTLYSEGASRLEPRDVGTTEEFKSGNKPILFPASFTIEAGRRMAADESGMQVNLYSEYPFPWRKDGGPRDAFQAEALAALEADPRQPYYQFSKIQGEPVLRYATARVMSDSCIRCHNEHPRTPKDDWVEGDVRGILEIIRPLQADMQRTRDGLRGAFVLVGVIAVLLSGIAGAMLLRSRQSNPGSHRR